MDPRVTKLAELIVGYSVGVKEGDLIVLQASPAAAPLVTELYRLALERGAQPLELISLPGLDRILLSTANDSQLGFIPPFLKYAIEHGDVRVRIMSDINTRESSGVDPARQALHAQAYGPLMETMMQRSATGALRWNVCLYPTDAYAQDADMALADFEDFVYSACLCDRDDPVAAWAEYRDRQQKLVEWLHGKSEVHLVGPDTDLRVGIAGREFVNCYGDKNMPDGEIFTGPQEDRVDGTVRFSFPAISGGRQVEDVRLWFEKGRVIRCSAARNQAYLERMLDTDEGARRLGEFAFGTNFGIQRFTKNILFDEKIGGTVHMALGHGYPETGSTNESAIHWDMICDLRQGGEVRVDGALFAKDGKYLLWE